MLTLVRKQIEFKEGYYDNVSLEDYLEASGVSSSRLGLFSKCPAKYYYLETKGKDPDAPTPEALIVGSAFHCRVLEPEKFKERYCVAPECDRRTTRGKAEWDEVRAANPGKIILKNELGLEVEDMAKSVLSNEAAVKFLVGNPFYERSLFWSDSKTKLLCKGRLDTYHETVQAIVDLKSTRDASPAEVARDIFVRGYYRQAAMYLRGAQTLGIPARHFIFIFVEKEAPYLVTIARLRDEILDLGFEENDRLLRRYLTCFETNTWPGYSDGCVIDIGVPAWAEERLKEASEWIN